MITSTTNDGGIGLSDVYKTNLLSTCYL